MAVAANNCEGEIVSTRRIFFVREFFCKMIVLECPISNKSCVSSKSIIIFSNIFLYIYLKVASTSDEEKMLPNRMAYLNG